MIEVNNKKKTGFLAKGLVKVYDDKDNIFYIKDFGSRVGWFNLPSGVFSINKHCIISQPKQYKLFALPKRQYKTRRQPERWITIWGENSNICTVNYNKGTMFFDNSLKNSPLFVVDFIKAHEIGHQFYKTEKYADLFAVNYLLEKGYNPSQIILIDAVTLSPFAHDRKKYILQKFKKQRYESKTK